MRPTLITLLLLLNSFILPAGGYCIQLRRTHTFKNTSLQASSPRILAQSGKWTAHLDEKYQTYFNNETGESSWEKPPGFKPLTSTSTSTSTSTKSNPLNSLLVSLNMKEEIVPSSTPLSLEFGTNILPHPEKRSWGGEDALFVSGSIFGVFDGVSGAEKLEGLPLYSKMFAEEMSSIASSFPPSSQTTAAILDMMNRAAEIADQDATGASTAVVASIGSDNKLRALSLGDSKCVVIRSGIIPHRTKDIMHFFDCPYQLGDESPDRPKDSTKLSCDLLPGDVVLMASDGVFDNVFDDELIGMVEEGSGGGGGGNIFSGGGGIARKIAKNICEKSRKNSLDRKLVTPFSEAAKKNKVEGFEDGLGGKVDDISCCVVVCTAA